MFFAKPVTLLAVFGKADLVDLMSSARHSSYDMAQRKDAAALLAIHERNPHPDNFVTKWQNIRIENDGGNTAYMSALGGSEQVPFKQLPSKFVRQHLGIPSGHILERDQIYLLRESEGYTKKHGLTAKEKLNALYVTRNVHPDHQPEFNEVVAENAREQFQAMMLFAGVGGASSYAGAHPAPPVNAMNQPPEKKARTEAGKNTDPTNIPERMDLAGFGTTRERLECIVRIRKQRTDLGGKTSKSAINFCKKYVNPIINCFELHFDGNIDAFVRFTNKLRNCCASKGTTVCTPKSK